MSKLSVTQSLYQVWINHVYTQYVSRNPITAVRIPITVAITAQAIFAYQRRVKLPAVFPTPAHCTQVVAAGGIIANRAHFPIGQPLALIALFGFGVFVTHLTIFDAHRFNSINGRFRWQADPNHHIYKTLHLFCGPVCVQQPSALAVVMAGSVPRPIL